MKILNSETNEKFKGKNECDSLPTLATLHISPHVAKQSKKWAGFGHWRITIIAALCLIFIFISMISWFGVLSFWTDDISETTGTTSNTLIHSTTETISNEPFNSTTTASSFFDSSSTEVDLTTISINWTTIQTTTTTSEFTENYISSTVTLPKNQTPSQILRKKVKDINGEIHENSKNCKKCLPSGPCFGSSSQTPQGHNITLSLLNIVNQNNIQNESLNPSVSVFVMEGNNELGIEQASFIALKEYFLSDKELQDLSSDNNWAANWGQGTTTFKCK